MNEHFDQPEGEGLLCPRCSAPYDAEDNFCRSCGFPLHEVGVPAVREGPYEPVVWQPSAPTVVKGAAVVAAGTLAEYLLRRLVSRMFRPRRFLPSQSDSAKRAAQVVEREEPLSADTQMVSETLVLKRVRFRR
jgi:hypothetical protein